MEDNQSAGPREELQKLVIQQKTIRMPGIETDHEGLQEAKTRLEQYDRTVSSLVIRVMQGEAVGVGMQQKDPDLDALLSALHQVLPAQLKNTAAQMRQYKEHLDKMMGLVMELSGQDPHTA